MDFADSVIADRLGAFTRALDANGSGGSLLLLSGVKVAQKGVALNGNTVLAILTFPKPSASAINGNTITLAQPATAAAIASGIVTWARYLDGSGNFVADAVVSQPANATGAPINGIAHGTGDIWIDDPQLWQGGAVEVTLGLISEA